MLADTRRGSDTAAQRHPTVKQQRVRAELARWVRSWRAATWILIAWTVAIVLVFLGFLPGQPACRSASDFNTCYDANAAAAGFAAAPFVILGVIGWVGLLIWWLLTFRHDE